jgi:hypothetical protein
MQFSRLHQVINRQATFAVKRLAFTEMLQGQETQNFSVPFFIPQRYVSYRGNSYEKMTGFLTAVISQSV